MKLLLIGILSVPLTVFAAPAELTACPDSRGPLRAVEAYLSAMQEHRFVDAYDHVAESMTDGRAREDWSALQKTFFLRGEVAIQSLEPLAALGDRQDAACQTRALVPNILRSSDRLNTEGVVEFELYTVVQEGGSWRIEAQETLYEVGVIRELFPHIEIVEVSLPE